MSAVTARDVPVLLPPRELTRETLPLFARVTASYFEGDTKGMVVDLSNVRHISSAGLGHLVSVGRHLDERGAVLALAGGPRRVVRLLEIIGLDAVMPHFPTVGEASEFVRTRERPI